MPTDGPARPDPKPAPRVKRYRRKIASAKQWQAILAAKLAPCRICGDPDSNGQVHGHIEMHHLVRRGGLFGDDEADNLVPLCRRCHRAVTMRDPASLLILRKRLTRAEENYCREKLGKAWEARL